MCKGEGKDLDLLVIDLKEEDHIFKGKKHLSRKLFKILPSFNNYSSAHSVIDKLLASLKEREEI